MPKMREKRKRKRKKDAGFGRLVSPTHRVTDSANDEKLPAGVGGGAGDGRLSITRRTTQNQRRAMGVMSSSEIQAEVRKAKKQEKKGNSIKEESGG